MFKYSWFDEEESFADSDDSKRYFKSLGALFDYKEKSIMESGILDKPHFSFLDFPKAKLIEYVERVVDEDVYGKNICTTDTPYSFFTPKNEKEALYLLRVKAHCDNTHTIRVSGEVIKFREYNNIYNIVKAVDTELGVDNKGNPFLQFFFGSKKILVFEDE